MITRRNAILIVFVALFTLLIGRWGYVRYWRNRRVNNRDLRYFREIIEDISEVIIPKTDSPGAKEAKVVDYIINNLENCIERGDRYIILNGLEDIEKYSLRNFSATFIQCALRDKISVLKHFETKGIFSYSLLNKIRRKIFGQSFFEQMKWLTVSGYCQSQLGATQGLAYDHIPVDFLSCIPYALDQKSWATK